MSNDEIAQSGAAFPGAFRPTPGALEALAERLTSAEDAAVVRGLAGAARGLALTRLRARLKAPIVAVAADEAAADRLEKDLRFFAPDAVVRLPADEILPYDDLTPDRAIELGRLRGLFDLHLGSPAGGGWLVVLSARALARRVLPRAALDARSLLLAKDQTLDRDELAKSLVAAGYDSSPLVEDPGTFAMRGGVIDVWTPLSEAPARIEFLGDTIESLRLFDAATQRTLREVESLSISPAREFVLDETTRALAVATLRAAADAVDHPSLALRGLIDDVNSGQPSFGLEAIQPGLYAGGLVPVADYLPKDAIWFVDDPLGVDGALGRLWDELANAFTSVRGEGRLALEPEKHFLSAAEVGAELKKHRRISNGGYLEIGGARGADLDPIGFGFGSTKEIRQEILQHHGEEGALVPLAGRLRDWRERGIATLIACHNSGLAERLRRMLLDRDLQATLHPGAVPADPRALYAPNIHAHLFVGDVSAGFVDAAGGIALVADEEIFGPRSERKVRRARSEQPFVAQFRDLKNGDLVVHVDHGVARYEGMTRMELRSPAQPFTLGTPVKVHGDFLILQFAGKDRLYLPVSRLRQVQKYSGGDPETAKLDSLGSSTFATRKKRVKEELLKMAAELLDLYATRAAHTRPAFDAPDAMYRQFEADFEFEETADQEKAIADVLSDMQRPQPMDRLVCGDVGYGKTEVALRAAFKAIEDKKQVAVLVPTTVLAAQHFHTFQHRFKDYPVNVEMVSRFRGPKETKDVLRRAAEGKVDVVVGTHKLLGKDVSFKNLGLVVIDEEQRFGVKHKEQLKKLRKLVDVLTLTATPIPRTLHMAMSGVRDMSIIATPPSDRRAIRTFVTKFAPGVIKEAIDRELARGGQVFFVHNRVESIGGMEQFLRELLPHARIGVGHGQMDDSKLEEVMTDFVERKTDILLCTAIIESGLDIPSANTIIVNRADQFGLSQLYQIRGRVGRSRERAYAYLLVPAERQVTRDAQKRLHVLQQFTELGAGFQIASHDLEIRGGGNILGEDQSGQIAAVGFELYTQLMAEAVAEMRGEALREEIDPDVSLPVTALIPEEYVPEVPQRLSFYKRFAQAQTEDELYDIKGELRDLCGEVPVEVDCLVELMSVKQQMRSLRMRALEAGPQRLVLTLGADAALDAPRLAELVAKNAKRGWRLTPELKLVWPLDAPAEGAQWLEAARKLLRELTAVAA